MAGRLGAAGVAVRPGPDRVDEQEPTIGGTMT